MFGLTQETEGAEEHHEEQRVTKRKVYIALGMALHRRAFSEAGSLGLTSSVGRGFLFALRRTAFAR